MTEAENELAKRAKWARKRQKGMSPFVKLDAGNVELNNARFNTASTPSEGPSTSPLGPMGEEYDVNDPMQDKILQKESREWEKLSDIADLLTRISPNRTKYEVKNTWKDYGNHESWTTIIAYPKDDDSYQILSPIQWDRIISDGLNPKAAVELLQSGKYWVDKKIDKPVTESVRLKELALDIEDAGGKENYIKQLLDQKAKLTKEYNFIKNQSKREVGLGAFDSQEEIDDALKNIVQELHDIRVKLATVDKKE